VAGGGSASRLLLGFMLATAAISMWISNSATTLMMLPVALAIIGDAKEPPPQPSPASREREQHRSALATPLLLGIAWAASIGGLGTPIGTPPNLIAVGAIEEATGKTVSFLEWMRYGLPAIAVILPLAWLLLARPLRGLAAPVLPPAGRWTAAEIRVLVLFGITALAWTFRVTPYGGWTGWVGAPGASDTTVALAAVLLMFLVPDGGGGKLLDWKSATDIPWGLLLLFGGGLALGEAFKSSGLAASMGDGLQQLSSWPELPLMLVICVAVGLASEIASNTALANLLMPVMAAAAVAADLSPATLMMTTGMAASLGFMLPIATAPNAIVVGTGRVDTGTMARLVLDVAGAVAIALAIILL
jgi:sodium-dependent dicarboxylate transporter 2/3/5